MIEIKKIKTKVIENINELARKTQKNKAISVAAAVGTLIFVGWFFMHTKKPADAVEKKAATQAAKMVGATDAQFSKMASQKALEEQQNQIKDLNDQLAAINNEMDVLQKALDEKGVNDINSNQGVVQELQSRINELENSLKKPGDQTAADLNNIGTEARSITTTNFSYADDPQNINAQKTQKIRTAKDYVPPGTFAKAVLLNGADTNAGVYGQTDTVPITMRVLDNGTLPNGGHSSLKGCFVTAAAYGDASSERGQIRLQRLSCIRKPSGWILDVPIEGTINDMGGSDGIRGHVVMRNNKLIWNAGVSGMLSGIGSAMQQSLTTQSVTPLGIANSIQPGKVAQSAAFGGANTALGKLADYYIKLADMYHPIVQVHAGSEVNIVFLKGFSLNEGLEAITPAPTAVEKTDNTQTTVPQNLMQNIRDSKLGQEVNINDNTDTGEVQ
jgi:hypothetical protein